MDATYATYLWMRESSLGADDRADDKYLSQPFTSSVHTRGFYINRQIANTGYEVWNSFVMSSVDICGLGIMYLRYVRLFAPAPIPNLTE